MANPPHRRRRRRIDSESPNVLKWAAVLIGVVLALWFGLMAWVLS
ncbi:hypothetical protein BH11PSE8_BH11PSE8_28900 [soil metagenome]